MTKTLHLNNLISQLRPILNRGGLDSTRAEVKDLVTELGVDFLDVSAALLCLIQQQHSETMDSHVKISGTFGKKPDIKMIRYRLEVGREHDASVETLCQLLIDESGVDKNWINIMEIHGAHTVIELPDEMPQDIYLHLKTLDVNGQKLDIKRIKSRALKHKSKKRHRPRPKSAKATNP